MNEPTKKILYDTYSMLLEQVEKDAPESLEDLQSNIGSGHIGTQKNVLNLSEIFQDRNLNPFKLPFEYFINGNLPDR